MSEEKTVYIKNEKDLRIFMHPLRQKVLRVLYQEGKPITAKRLADCLSITHSSAKYHLQQLETIGLVAFHHTELIHGIRATFYEALPVTVSLSKIEDQLDNEKKVLLQNMIASIFESYLIKIDSIGKDVRKLEHFEADLVSGVAHLTQDQADKVYQMIVDFVKRNETAGEDTYPFEYVLIAYKVQPK